MHTEETQAKVWAHCLDPRCQGHNQVEIDGLRRETFHSFRDRGGDMPGIESSFVSFHFQNEDEAQCPHCGQNREVSGQPRRRYAPLSGHDPMGLLEVTPYSPARQAEMRQKPMADDERERMERENEALREQLRQAEEAIDKALVE